MPIRIREKDPKTGKPKQRMPIAPVPGRPQAAPDQDFMGTRPLVDEAANSNRSKRAAKTSGSGLGYKKGGKMPLPKPKPRHANPKHPMNTERTGPLRKAGGGKLKMVEKGGKKVPFFAADGVGKMAAGGSMKIKSGDTLSQIAKKRGVSLKALLAANPSIKNANKIRVGQSIKIPGAEAGKASKTSNPYKGISRVQMADMDVKNKSEKRQRTATRSMQAQAKMGTGMTPTPSKAAATKEKKSGREAMMSKARKLRDSKKASNDQVDVSKGTPAMNKTASLKNVASSENKRLEALRQKARSRADRRMGGGTMNKKVMAYKKGGVMRGTGAATKGKGFSGCY